MLEYILTGRSRYCHRYKCPSGACYDGKHLLILLFIAQGGPSDIQRQDCQVYGILFRNDCPQLRYGLFRTASLGLRRCQAETAPPLELDGYTRRFQWWSGKPFWVANGFTSTEHPNGYMRTWNQDTGAWHWAHQDGTPVMDADGNVVWDTGALW